MGLKNFLSAQFASVIEWPNQAPDLLVYRYPAPTAEIKNASKLLVAPGQGCLLVYEGQVTAVLTEEGLYPLDTANHPFITSLLRLRQGFESEHKLRVYFFRQAEVVSQPWGTATPVKYVDPVYGFPVEMGMHGSYSFKIVDAQRFFAEVVGSRDAYTASEARTLIQARIGQHVVVGIAAAAISCQVIDSQLAQLSAALRAALNAEFAGLGFELTDFKLSGTAFDKDTQARIKQIADMRAATLAAAEGSLSYAESQKLSALRDAARNTGGLAGVGAQLGAGLELSKAFGSTPAPDAPDPVAQLQKLKRLLDEGILTPEEFEAKKKEWLAKL
ncbi:SPFH domain-containing protein [Hymenobacter negativus]|uniref:SPFH domain-containing protein n=1 Tax=Hymenobacter negativus TaxID=2795026 RepID=A0ABS3Q9R7_9BACT|nr:SPFH domain-containing protein [Hymenobacter negativus]MBO2007979.1 SPFH domain-containing protein [Hymenobacter negativus]